MRARVLDRIDPTTAFGVALAVCWAAVLSAGLALVILSQPSATKAEAARPVVYDKPATVTVIGGVH